MKTGISVGEAMTCSPVILSPETNVVECAKVMAEKHVGSIAVGEDGNIVGLVTEQDIVRKSVASGLNCTRTPLKAVMSTDLHTISPDRDIFEALTLMSEKNVRHVPVTDKKGGLVGYITGKDILKLQPQLFEILVDKIELREQERKLTSLR